MRIGSMFSGVEGMGLGVAAATGGEIVWHCETDPAASSVLERQFAAPNLGDVTLVDWAMVEPVDLLIGGPPCQAISQAGLMLGMADPRWMWPEAFRAMACLRPRWVLWENPMGLLNGRQREDDDADRDMEPDDETVGGTAAESGWFGHVLGEMAALGYVGRWGCLRSADVGAPHGRARIFIAAADASGERHGGGQDGGGVGRVDGAHARPARERAWPVAGDRSAEAVADPPHVGCDGTGPARGRGTGPVHGDRTPGVTLLPTPTARDGKGVDIPGRLGSPSLPSMAALLPMTTPASGIGHARDLGSETRFMDARWVASLPDGRTIDYGPAVRRWESLFEPAPPPRDDKGRLNPDLPRWMMGYPTGWLDDIPRTAALRCAGNGCQPQVAELATRILLPELT